MLSQLLILRKKMTTYYVLILIVLIAVFLLAMYLNLYYSSRWAVDQGLKSIAKRVVDVNEMQPISDIPASNVKDIFIEEHEPVKFIIRDKNLSLLVSNDDNPEMIKLGIIAAGEVLADGEERWETIQINRAQMRLYTAPFANAAQSGVVQTYCNFSMISSIISRFTHFLVVFGIIGVMAAALIGWRLAGKAIKPVAEMWQQQKNFVADASHELRTPLTIMQSNLDVVMADENGSIQENCKWLQNAYSETENMGKLVNDLLLLARVDAKEIQIMHNTVDLSHLAQKAAEQFMPLFYYHELIFNTDIADNIIINGDRDRLRQLIGILLDNAAKYTPAGGKVHLRLKNLNNKTVMEVEDTGIGIEQSELGKIFHRFYRVDKARSRKQGGTGLGLSIAAWIVESHNGSIRVESDYGKGSIFIIEMPGINK